MNKKVLKITAISIIAIIIVVGGYLGIKKYQGSKSTVSNNNFMAQSVKKGQIDVSVQSTGTVFAGVSKEIVANNSGEIKDLNIKVGDVVKSGDKLFKVDSEQIKQQLTSAELSLEKQKLQLEKAKSEEEVNIQTLSLKEAQNNLSNIKSQCSNMTVKSPINGLVIEKNNNTGDNVQSGKTVLTIVDPTSLKVKAAVDELDISKIAKGQKVTIKLNAIADKTYEGTVETISDMGNTQNNVTSYDVTIVINNPSGIKLGMTANVNIQVASKKDALLIPAEALTDRNGKKYVMVAETANSSEAKDKTAANENQQGNEGQKNIQSENRRNAQGQRFQGTGRLVEVKTGLQNENFIEITEGLTEGQRVLITIPTSIDSSTTIKNRNTGGFTGGMPGGMSGGGARMTGRD